MPPTEDDKKPDPRLDEALDRALDRAVARAEEKRKGRAGEPPKRDKGVLDTFYELLGLDAPEEPKK